MSPIAEKILRVEMNRISKGADLTEGMVQRLKGKKADERRKARVGAFTLIELLAVIAIIAILAGLVLATAGLATRKSREGRLKGEHQRLVTSLDVYKTDMGNFPPDNQDKTQKDSDFQTDRHIKAGLNSLFYELSGCTFDNAGGGTFTTQNKSDSVLAKDLKAAFGVKGVENSARSKKDIPLKTLITFRPNQHEIIDAFPNVEILIAPLPGPYDSKFPAKGGKKLLNPWFYDASSTNRHNMETYDLWGEYKDGKDTKVIGNWNQ